MAIRSMNRISSDGWVWPRTAASVPRSQARLPVVSPAPILDFTGGPPGRAFMLHPGGVPRNRETPSSARSPPHRGREARREAGGLERIMAESGLPLGLASLQRDAAAGRKLPPVEKWNPATLRRHRHPHRARRHLVPQWHADRPPRAGAPVLDHPAQGRRTVFISSRPVEKMRIVGGGCAVPRRLAARRRRGPGAASRSSPPMSATKRLPGPDNPIRVETDPGNRGAVRLMCMCAAASKPRSRAPSSISSPTWRCRAKANMEACSACGAMASSFRWGRLNERIG